MIYSKWIPDRGGSAYYETSERRGLGDDLPVPQLRNTSGIGVASTDIGRALPLGAKITKTAEHRYEGWQLNPAVDCSLLIRDTAIDCIADFTHHFHMGGGTLAVAVLEQPVAIDGTMIDSD